jgi:hypothetical protein
MVLALPTHLAGASCPDYLFLVPSEGDERA